MKQTLDEQEAQMKRINEIARRLVSLTDDPHLGLISWWRFFTENMADIEKEMVAR